MEETIPKVKVGDELAFHNRYHGYSLETVTKITPTGIIKCGDKFALNPDLTIRGDRASFVDPYRGEVVTDEIREKILRQNLLRRLDCKKWADLTTNKLKKLVAIIDQKNT